jgi:Fe2+ transport system protein FeoA
MKFSLAQLPIGKSGFVEDIDAEQAIKERLHSLGLIEGIRITPVRETPLGCPRIYRCLNTLIAIRNYTARQIYLKQNK